MEVLRSVIVLLHIVGFAVVFGAWIAEAAARRFTFTALMNYGLLMLLLTGIVLAAPWPAGFHPNYPKIIVKSVILLAMGAVMGIGKARQGRTGQPPPRPLFLAAGLLTFLAAAIAVIW